MYGGFTMDVLEVIDKIDNIEILFEPIYSADEHIIVAYEALGTLSINNETINIIEFLYDEKVPIDIRSEVEQSFINQVLTVAKDELKDNSLLLPCNPNLFMIDFGESYLELLKKHIEEPLLSQLYLTMRINQYDGELNQLIHPIRYFKTYGIKVVLDQLNSDSKLEQLLVLEPNIIKMKVSQLNYDAWGTQTHIVTTIQSLALKMGAMLMFDEITTDYQLHLAWKNGARYFKGSYLQKPSNQFVMKEELKERFHNDCKQFISTEIKLLEAKYEEMDKLRKLIMTIVDEVKPSNQDDEKLLELAKKLDNIAFRFYICDEEGYQTSPNIVKKDGQWQVDDSKIGKNWSWRPYFLMNIIRLRHNGKGKLSDPYNDIDTGEMTRTFSMALQNQKYLFIDIDYEYLYEHNIVK